MGKKKIALFLVLSFVLLTANAGAYQGCNGEYTPYPVKCIGGGGSAYSGNQVNIPPEPTTTTSESQASSNGSSINMSSLSWNYNLLETIWIIAGLVVIVYFVKKIFFRRRHHRHHRR